MYTEKQIEAVRKHWLVSFIGYSVFNYLLTLMMSSSLLIRIIPGYDLSLKDVSMRAWAFEQVIIAKLLLFFLITWLIYFFAYKTKGIKLLSFIWFIGGFIFLYRLYLVSSCLFEVMVHSQVYSYNFEFETGFLTIHSLIDAVYIYFSYQLFCVNKFLLYKDDK